MSENIPVEQAWVTTGEGAELTGYNQEYLEVLARKNWKKPEAERQIKIRNRSRRYELWLPDLVNYLSARGRGPRKNSDE